MLAQQVQTGALVFLQGHLSLDLRPQERSPTHGPALVVEADSWELVTATTVPNGRALCTYKGGCQALTMCSITCLLCGAAGHVTMLPMHAAMAGTCVRNPTSACNHARVRVPADVPASLMCHCCCCWRYFR